MISNQPPPPPSAPSAALQPAHRPRRQPPPPRPTSDDARACLERPRRRQNSAWDWVPQRRRAKLRRRAERNRDGTGGGGATSKGGGRSRTTKGGGTPSFCPRGCWIRTPPRREFSWTQMSEALPPSSHKWARQERGAGGPDRSSKGGDGGRAWTAGQQQQYDDEGRTIFSRKRVEQDRRRHGSRPRARV